METKREPCPKCRSIGKDTAGDNLCRWLNDGHAHCFACQYHEFPNGLVAIMGNLEAERLSRNVASQAEQTQYNNVVLPADAQANIDFTALTWLTKYDIEMNEVIKYKMLWSPSKRMLIFPLYENDLRENLGLSKVQGNKLLAWQARVFNSNYNKKYYTVGDIQQTPCILNLINGKGNDLIIVEDYLSAIKIARRFTVMPLFGSHLSIGKLKQLQSYSENLTIWLDEDKMDTSLAIAQTSTQLGFNAKVIITKHDPKEYNNAFIQETIETHPY